MMLAQWQPVTSCAVAKTLPTPRLYIGEPVHQRCKKWWNRGTGFPESILACTKFWDPRRETITVIKSAGNFAVFVKHLTDFMLLQTMISIKM
jgi:hypothetical protein